MKTRSLCLLLAIVLAAWMPLMAEEPNPAAPLAPIAWMVGDWHATASAPSRKPIEIDLHIYWNETKTALFFLTQFDGKPHYSGMYAWNPAAHAIGFWYVDDVGNFSEGTAKPSGERIVQEFTIAHPDGNVERLLSYVEPAKDKDSYHWQVQWPGQTQPLVQLEYARKK